MNIKTAQAFSLLSLIKRLEEIIATGFGTSGQTAPLKELIEQAMTEARLERGTLEEVRMRKSRAVAAYQAGQYQSALDDFDGVAAALVERRRFSEAIDTYASCASVYERLGRLAAARTVSIDVATASAVIEDPSVSEFVWTGLLMASDCDFERGFWRTASSLLVSGLLIHGLTAPAAMDVERYGSLQESFDRLVTIIRAAELRRVALPARVHWWMRNSGFGPLYTDYLQDENTPPDDVFLDSIRRRYVNGIFLDVTPTYSTVVQLGQLEVRFITRNRLDDFLIAERFVGYVDLVASAVSDIDTEFGEYRISCEVELHRDPNSVWQGANRFHVNRDADVANLMGSAIEYVDNLVRTLSTPKSAERILGRIDAARIYHKSLPVGDLRDVVEVATLRQLFGLQAIRADDASHRPPGTQPRQQSRRSRWQ